MKTQRKIICVYLLLLGLVLPGKVWAQKGLSAGIEAGTILDQVGRELLNYGQIHEGRGYRVAFVGGNLVAPFVQFGFGDKWALKISGLVGRRLLRHQFAPTQGNPLGGGRISLRSSMLGLTVPVTLVYRKRIWSDQPFFVHLIGGGGLHFAARSQMQTLVGLGVPFQRPRILSTNVAIRKGNQSAPMGMLVVGVGLGSVLRESGIFNLSLKMNWIPSRAGQIKGRVEHGEDEFEVDQLVNYSYASLTFSWGFNFRRPKSK